MRVHVVPTAAAATALLQRSLVPSLQRACSPPRSSVARMSTEASEAKPGFGSRSKRRTRAAPAEAAQPVPLLRRTKGWVCIAGCGACCYLQPSERPDLPDYLSEEELTLYTSMVAEDGWCKHFDKTKRACTIYEERPDFCRVTPKTFARMYGVEAKDMDSFCTECCQDQISDVYGSGSAELKKFNKAVKDLQISAATPTDPFTGTERPDRTAWETD